MLSKSLLKNITEYLQNRFPEEICATVHEDIIPYGSKPEPKEEVLGDVKDSMKPPHFWVSFEKLDADTIASDEDESDLDSAIESDESKPDNFLQDNEPAKIRYSLMHSNKVPPINKARNLANDYPRLQVNRSDEITDIFNNLDEGFSSMLTKYIDRAGMSDADCYKKAQINKSHFNKIKNDKNYNVQKDTVFALIIALSLNKEDADALLERAGYAFSSSSKFDALIEYCIDHKIYNLMEVNEILYTFDQKLLGAGIRE